MKKPLIYSLAATALIASTVFTVAVSATNSTTTSESTSVTTEAPLAEVPDTISTSADETIYIITDDSGTMTKSFLGSTLNTSSAPMPIEMHITYSLDGHSISPAELAGKSGHVKITYDFTATSKAPNGKLIPFLTVTSLSLDTHKFSNIKLDSGKVIKESDDLTVLAGYAMPGLGTDLDADFLPSSFSIEADTTDFTLGNTYTFATNELFAEIDTSKLSTLDDLVSSMSELSSALDQIISGASSLSDGLDSAHAGAIDLAAGAAELSNGLDSLVDFNNQSLAKLNAAIGQAQAEIAPIMTEIETILADPDCPPELVAKFTELKSSFETYYSQASTAVTTYTGNIEKLADGASKLKAGADSLASGLGQLSSGSHTLYSGLTTFKQQGIDQLVNFANRDLYGFLNNLRATVDAADSYHHYSDPHATSVKFIFKSPSLTETN